MRQVRPPGYPPGAAANQPLPSRGHERPRPAGVDRRRTSSGARLSRCAARGGRRRGVHRPFGSLSSERAGCEPRFVPARFGLRGLGV